MHQPDDTSFPQGHAPAWCSMAYYEGISRSVFDLTTFRYDIKFGLQDAIRIETLRSPVFRKPENAPESPTNAFKQRSAITGATERNGRHVTGKGREHQRELATKGLHTYRYIAYTVAYYSKVSCYRRITTNWVSFRAGTLYYTIGEHSCERQKHPDDKGRSGCTNDP